MKEAVTTGCVSCDSRTGRSMDAESGSVVAMEGGSGDVGATAGDVAFLFEVMKMFWN